MPRLKYKLDLPVAFEFTIDKDKLRRKIGTDVAKEVRRAADAGQSLDGSSLPKSREGRRLKNSGQLIRSIKSSVRKGKPAIVSPKGYRDDDGKPHAKVLNSIAKKRGIRDILGTQSEKVAEIIDPIVKKWIKKAKDGKGFRLKAKKRKRVRRG